MDVRAFLQREGITEAAALPLEGLKILNAPLLARTLPNAKTALLFLIPYYVGTVPGNLSLYARSKDYHLFAKDLSLRLCALLKEHYPANDFRVFADHSPIDEVEAAVLGGLGVLGDNGLLINRRYGSFVFIGELLTDLPPKELGYPPPPMKKEGCLHCGACKRACPCHFDGCASGIGQKKGTLTKEEEMLVLKTGLAWGCDRCQLVCPMNKEAEKTPIPFFYEDRMETLDSKALDALSKEAFEQRAFAWRGRAVIARNLALFEENGAKAPTSVNETGETKE